MREIRGLRDLGIEELMNRKPENSSISTPIPESLNS
jgi:hypothetical protein